MITLIFSLVRFRPPRPPPLIFCIPPTIPFSTFPQADFIRTIQPLSKALSSLLHCFWTGWMILFYVSSHWEYNPFFSPLPPFFYASCPSSREIFHPLPQPPPPRLCSTGSNSLSHTFLSGISTPRLFFWPFLRAGPPDKIELHSKSFSSSRVPPEARLFCTPLIPLDDSF